MRDMPVCLLFWLANQQILFLESILVGFKTFHFLGSYRHCYYEPITNVDVFGKFILKTNDSYFISGMWLLIYLFQS
jgi:hypothetical protein